MGKLIKFKKRLKQEKPTKKEPEKRFENIIKASSSGGLGAAMLRGEIEESPREHEINKVKTNRERIMKADIPASDREILLSYLDSSEKKGTRGAIHRAGEITRLYFEKSDIFASEIVIKGELELMASYERGELEDLAEKVIRRLWKNKDNISKLWVEAINKAMNLEILRGRPSRRESALFYILKVYYYTTYPNSMNYPKEELAEKIEHSINVLDFW